MNSSQIAEVGRATLHGPDTLITSDGTRLYFEDWGRGQPIVFSHGWPLTADAWDDQMVFFAERGYRCIAHDRRGHGRSSQPWHGNDMNTYADDVVQFCARALVNGANYDFELRYVAALADTNCYSLRTQSSWAHQPASSHAHFQSTFASWLQLWTRELTPAEPPAEHEIAVERYHALVAAALHAEAHLDTVAAIQRAIVDGLRRGARFATSHKEGGTTITWNRDRFVRVDHGENPDCCEYADELSFLAMLRQFLHSDVSRHAVTKPPPEFDVWKLILRRMSAPT